MTEDIGKKKNRIVSDLNENYGKCFNFTACLERKMDLYK